MIGTKRLIGVSVGTQYRWLVALMVVVVSGIGTDGVAVLPWVAAVLVVDLVAGRVQGDLEPSGVDGRRRQAMLALVLLGALAAGLGLLAGPSALPLVVLPLSRAASALARVEVMGTALVWVLAGLAVRRMHPSSTLLDVALDVRWTLIAAVAAAGAVWVHRTNRVASEAQLTATANPAAEEAAILLSRLDALTSDLEGGLDPATAAELLLDALGRPGPLARSAVLIGGAEDQPVPLALRGVDRVPWGDPLVDPGAVGQAWRSGRPATVFDPAEHREVRAVPLRASDGSPLGLVVQDVMTTAPSAPYEREPLEATAARLGPVIGVALSFAALRERAGFEERERLAREMHDGIAQELVALGFRLDLVARTLDGPHGSDPEKAGEMLAEARGQLRRILGDLRSHISDLRVSVRPERGLGATMTSRLQSFGTSTEVVVGLRLDESGFRLPARVETALYQLFLDVLADVKDGGATGVDVDLTVVAPDATLRMRHDGRTTFSPARFTEHQVTAAGGTVTVDTTDGLDLVATFRTPQTHTSPVHVNEKVPQPS